eukprot:scaffold138326_cov23-Tisochrysis_lutea.AAC.1
MLYFQFVSLSPHGGCRSTERWKVEKRESRKLRPILRSPPRPRHLAVADNPLPLPWGPASARSTKRACTTDRKTGVGGEVTARVTWQDRQSGVVGQCAAKACGPTRARSARTSRLQVSRRLAGLGLRRVPRGRLARAGCEGTPPLREPAAPCPPLAQPACASPGLPH